MKSNLKITNIEFDVPTLHSSKASKEFKSCFRHLIKQLNSEVRASKGFHTSWIVREPRINSSNISIIEFCDYCNIIASYNYPNHDIKFRVNHFVGQNSTIEVVLQNKLKI